jgi:predicted permease
LFVRTLDALMTKGPGFPTASLTSFGIDCQRSGYSKEEGNRLIRRIDEAIRHAPIIQSSAIASFPLLTGGSWNDPMTILAGKRFSTDGEVNLNSVTPGFFPSMGIKIIAGRNFDERDIAAPGERDWRSAIVNEAFVKRYLGGRNPLGVRICEGSGPDAKPNTEIVGVVSNFSYRGIREESEQAYFPFEGEAAATFYVRVHGGAESSFRALRAIVGSIDPALPMTRFRTLEEQVDRSLSTERMLTRLSSSFGMLALLVSLVGLYGVMSFVVTQRTREIGIRLALGARRWSAIWLVLRDALAMVLCGIAIGLPFVWALGRLMESQLYNVKPFDPTVSAIAILALCSAGLGAALIPAHRASGVNPTDALRFE